MRSLRHELASFALVLPIPLAIIATFPYAAVSFRADLRPTSEPGVAFVTLTPAEEAQALRAAKTSWQIDASGDRRLGVRLPLGELPAEKEGAILGLSFRTPALAMPSVEYAREPWRPSAAAPRPSVIKSKPDEGVRETPPFSRNDLLELKN